MKYFCLFLGIGVLCFSAHAQAYEDSLLNIIQGEFPEDNIKEATFLLGEYLVQRNPEQAENYALQLQQMSATPRDSSEWGRLYYIFAASHRWQGNYKTALQYYHQLYHYYKRQKDPANIARSGKKIGTLQVYLGNNIVAQEHLLECAEIYQNTGTPREIASINNSLANFYLNIEQEEKALERYQEALEQFTILQDSAGIASINANLGSLYTERGEYEKAENHLAVFKAMSPVFPTEREIGFYYDFLGILRQEQGQLQEAYRAHRAALEIRERLSSTYNLCESKLNLGQVLVRLGREAEAIDHLKEVLNFEEHDSYSQQQLAHSLLSEAYEKQQNYQEALVHYKAYKTVSDSIYNEKSIKVIAEKDARYLQKEKDAEIVLLNKENEITQARLSRSRLMIFGSLLALIIFTLFSVYSYRMYRKIKGQNVVIQKALKDKNLLIHEIHHRVKNNLQVISSLLHLQSRFIKDENALEAIKDGRNRVQSMAILHKNLYREEDITGVNMKIYFSNLVEGIFNSYNLTHEQVQLDLDIEDLSIDVDAVIPIGLITNELITNSLKHAFEFQTDEAAKIEVKLKESNQRYELMVRDNGIGMDDEIIERSPDQTFGQRMIHAFVNKLKADIQIRNQSGTEVIISIPKLATVNP